MIRACKEEMHKCPNEEVERLAMMGSRRIRGRPRKNWRKAIRHDMTKHHLTGEDMNVSR